MHTSENVDLKMHTSENTRSQNANIYFLISEPVYLDLILIGNPCHTWSAPEYHRYTSTLGEMGSTPCTSAP